MLLSAVTWRAGVVAGEFDIFPLTQLPPQKRSKYEVYKSGQLRRRHVHVRGSTTLKSKSGNHQGPPKVGQTDCVLDIHWDAISPKHKGDSDAYYHVDGLWGRHVKCSSQSKRETKFAVFPKVI